MKSFWFMSYFLLFNYSFGNSLQVFTDLLNTYFCFSNGCFQMVTNRSIDLYFKYVFSLAKPTVCY